jgi:hypothetical protein
MKRAAIGLVLVCGCVAVAPTSAPPPEPPPPPDPPPADPFALMVQPRLGQVVIGDPRAATISFVGVAAAPGAAIDIQVPTSPLHLDQWTTIVSTTAEATPSSTDPSMYEWHVTVAPAALDPSRWLPGGVLRARAVAADGSVLGSFFHDSDACLAAVSGWRERAVQCGAALPTGVVIVNASASPTDLASRPRFLDRRGWVPELETSTYYQTIAAPTTLASFRTTYAFDGNETTTVYYNAGDLGIGRGMHCAAQSDGGLACYVSNYGTFGGETDDALTRAVNGEAAGGTGAFATVAMVYAPPIDAPNSVRFIVYNAAGSLATSAALDTVGENTSIPNNCLNCHGVAAHYDDTTHTTLGAHFLPFDSANLKFPTLPGLTANDQSAALIRLNTMVAQAGATPAIAHMSNDPSFVPVPWSTTNLDKAVYRNVTAFACRNCHATVEGSLAFETAADFRAQRTAIEASICSTARTMPNAEVPFERIWNGPARAYIAAYLELPGGCAP